jgi:hypothetical protein
MMLNGHRPVVPKHQCKPAIHILYNTFIKNKNECEFLSQPGLWDVSKSSYRTRAQITIL